MVLVLVSLFEVGAPERFAVVERRFIVVSKPMTWLDLDLVRDAHWRHMAVPEPLFGIASRLWVF